MNQLDQLKTMTTVVADTGDFQQLAAFSPQDATTNPSLVLKAVQLPAYQPLLNQIVADHRKVALDDIVDRLLVGIGCELLKMVPGRVSTEVDARLSFDTPETVARARRLLSFYEDAGVDRSRILVKIAATWEGIEAARILSSDGIRCNLTLLFSLPQAVACANAKVQLISPFVGRIYDWHKKTAGAHWNEEAMAGVNDPGVQSVTQIYDYYKQHGVATEIMGASFRNTGQILGLAGCDLMTISPQLLAELASSDNEVQRVLNTPMNNHRSLRPIPLDESAFRLALNRDAMATEKLFEGIRQFEADTTALENLVNARKTGSR